MHVDNSAAYTVKFACSIMKAIALRILSKVAQQMNALTVNEPRASSAVFSFDKPLTNRLVLKASGKSADRSDLLRRGHPDHDELLCNVAHQQIETTIQPASTETALKP